MNTSQFFSELNIRLHHDPEAQPVPQLYHVFMHGVETVVTPKDATAAGAAQAWCEVVAHVQYRRSVAKRDKDVDLAYFAPCTVYAGSMAPESIAELRIQHMREFMLQQLHLIAANRNAQGSGRVAALAMLAKLYGVKMEPARVQAEPSAVTRVQA